jgi:hypothetical protein
MVWIIAAVILVALDAPWWAAAALFIAIITT